MKPKVKISKRRIPKFMIVESDQWQALYVDGVLVYQHHEVPLIRYLKAEGIDIDLAWAEGDPTLEESSQFPDKLEDVVFDEDPQGF